MKRKSRKLETNLVPSWSDDQGAEFIVTVIILGAIVYCIMACMGWAI